MPDRESGRLSIGCTHFLNTRNVGDRESGPYRHVRLGPVAVSDIREKETPQGVMIYGGGAVGNRLRRFQNRPARTKLRIAWGVGFTNWGSCEPGPIAQGFDLFGSREWKHGNGAVYSPCPSCLSPVFDQTYEIKNDVVLYTNKAIRSSPIVPDIPAGHNEMEFAEAIAFLGSADCILTNSYHGALWGTILGRKVVILKPYSSKFYNYQFQPAMANEVDEWRSKARKARAFPEAKEELRGATLDFCDEITKLLEGL